MQEGNNYYIRPKLTNSLRTANRRISMIQVSRDTLLQKKKTVYKIS